MRGLISSLGLAGVGLILASACGQGPQQAADLVVVEARIWTGDPGRPWAEGLAVNQGRLTAVGDDAEVRRFIGPETRVIEGRGRMVVPGFIDSHIHFLQGGRNLASVQLRDASTPAEFVKRIGDFAAKLEKGAWITGGDWDHENWGGQLPQASWIDQASPDNPVAVNRLDGHMILANGAAMRAAGIDENTADVEGGTIVRGASGRPSGVFKDNALSLIYRVVPPPPPERDDQALQAAMQYVARQGVTSVHHMGDWDDLEVFRRAHRRQALTTRIYAAVPLSDWRRLQEEVQRVGQGDEWLRIGGLKGFVDGSLGSHTAAFHEPYTDAPQDRGLLVNSLEDLAVWIEGGDQAQLQPIVHAIGDRAISGLLDIFEKTSSANGDRDRRFRVEHAQHIAVGDLKRFARLGVIASMQPYHAIDDGRWAEKLIGPERIQTTYAFRSLLDEGVLLAFGSDWHVAPPTPLQGIEAAVTRRTLDGKNPEGWVPQQKIGVEDALNAYTRNAAYASFEEGFKGSLEVGKAADFVLLERDLTAIEPSEIGRTRVLLTVVAGRPVFEADSID